MPKKLPARSAALIITAARLELMLEVLDDYLSSRGQHGTKQEGRNALRQHYPEMTSKQIESVLRRWKKELDASNGW